MTIKYRIEVTRNPNVDLGLGTMKVWFGDAPLEEFPVLTGWQELNPFHLGGITPPIPWRITELIKRRNHPNDRRGLQVMTRIEPATPEDNELFSKTLGNRTFGLNGPNDYPFMIHSGRRVTPREGIPKTSTGCIVVYKQWKYATSLLNAAFYHAEKYNYELIVTVQDSELNTSYTREQRETMEERSLSS